MTRVVCYEVWDGPFFAGRRDDWMSAVACGARLANERCARDARLDRAASSYDHGIRVTETVELTASVPGALPGRVRREIVAWSIP